jgi:HK97 gp10 family phage protein
MGKSVVGLESLLKKLNKLGGNVEETLYNSVEKQTKLVQGDAKDLCPVDLGDLRNSIKGTVKKYKGRIVGVVSTNSDHAAYVEFGTGKVGERTNKNTNVNVSYKQDKWLVNIPDVGPRWIEGQAAQPYLYPALKNNEEKIIENIKEDVIKAIREVAKK